MFQVTKQFLRMLFSVVWLWETVTIIEYCVCMTCMCWCSNTTVTSVPQFVSNLNKPVIIQAHTLYIQVCHGTSMYNYTFHVLVCHVPVCTGMYMYVQVYTKYPVLRLVPLVTIPDELESSPSGTWTSGILYTWFMQVHTCMYCLIFFLVRNSTYFRGEKFLSLDQEKFSHLFLIILQHITPDFWVYRLQHHDARLESIATTIRPGTRGWQRPIRARVMVPWALFLLCTIMLRVWDEKDDTFSYTTNSKEQNDLTMWWYCNGCWLQDAGADT